MALVLCNDDRQTPHSTDAEHGVLGAIMKDPDTIAPVMEILRGEEFFHPRHRVIFEAVSSLFKQRQPADITTVANALLGSGQLENAGGRVYLVQMVEAVTSAAHVKKYAEIVRDKFLYRQMIDMMGEFTASAYQQDDSPHNIASKLYGWTGQIMTGRTEAELSARTLHDAVIDELSLIRSPKAVAAHQYGFKKLDEMTGGYENGQMIVWGARPKVGKTSILADLARNACKQGKPILFFTAEMSSSAFARRLICSEAGVSYVNWKRLALTDEDHDKLEKARQRIASWPFHIIGQKSIDVDRLAFIAHGFVKRKGVVELFVDYFQQLSTTFRGQEREQLNYIAKQLDDTAGVLKVPLHVGAQLNRGPEGKRPRRPQLGDLKGTGDLEQRGHAIHLIHRPELTTLGKDKKNVSNLDGKAEIISYVRDGESGMSVLYFEAQYSRFMDDQSMELPLGVTPVKQYKETDGDLPF